MPIRIARPEDTARVLNLLIAMHGEVGMAPLNLAKVRTLVEQLTGGEGVVLIAESEAGEAIGTIGLNSIAGGIPMRSSSGDCWTYVAPAARRGRTAARLIRAAREIARAAGLPLLMGVLGPKDSERKMRLFGRMLTPIGGIFYGE